MGDLSAGRWRAESTVVWVTYPDSTDWVAYHPLAGTVHCLTEAARQLWLGVLESPKTAAELKNQLVANHGIASDDLELQVQDALAAMDQAGLVTPASE